MARREDGDGAADGSRETVETGGERLGARTRALHPDRVADKVDMEGKRS